ncbi:glucans biosynthesis glucosyltransferase MdoH [Labedella endophytica]|uniref:Glucans biosynthesis glucosyltransferase H n=1 Tax=Labedella endophytica TaxID=1523160 RepID=A0A433JPP4_9MICO|nr:glucans biosynthesis glucosyltransferase MdoH [Labedella endophytica]RUQ98913.1 glucans biosynthesis glucosyltransferase MdoH [Labedella endophytica]
MSGRHASVSIGLADARSSRPARGRAAPVAIATALTTALGTAVSLIAAHPGGFEVAEVVSIALFVLCFAWIAFAFCTAVAGFVRLLSRRPLSGLIGPQGAADASTITSRVALIVPVRNEDPHAVFANVRAIGESIGRSRHPDLIDFFILSDTVDPDVLVAEELAWTELRGHLAGICEVFYRRRTDNDGKKAGNLAEFCRRWGAAYEYFLVLDADSLMEADTIITMTRIMELNPGVGILQAPPLSVGGLTRFARLQQFAGFAYGSVVTAGMSAWQGGSSNYWGHNAIIRTAAFARYCGLPVLSGSGPFSGEILSHDFVEAALMRRAGYEVWMLPALGGSFERIPPTLFDYAERDRRWSAGNLQHLRLLGTSGLHPMSRLHLFLGAMSYLVSPLWLLFIASGVAMAISDAATPGIRGVDSFAAGAVFAASTLLVFTPRLLGVALVLRDRDVRQALGGTVAVIASGLVEIVVSALLAPVTMVMQTTALVSILSGAHVSWGSQRRDGDVPSLVDLLRVHGAHLVLGITLLVAGVVTPGALPWLALMIASLLGAPALTLWTAGEAPSGSPMDRLLRIPEEAAPSRVCSRAEELRAVPAPAIADGLRRVVTDARAYAVHLAILDTTGSRDDRVPASVARLVHQGAWERIDQIDRALALGSATFLRNARSSHTPAVAHRSRRLEPLVVT